MAPDLGDEAIAHVEDQDVVVVHRAPAALPMHPRKHHCVLVVDQHVMDLMADRPSGHLTHPSKQSDDPVPPAMVASEGVAPGGVPGDVRREKTSHLLQVAGG